MSIEALLKNIPGYFAPDHMNNPFTLLHGKVTYLRECISDIEGEIKNKELLTSYRAEALTRMMSSEPHPIFSNSNAFAVSLVTQYIRDCMVPADGYSKELPTVIGLLRYLDVADDEGNFHNYLKEFFTSCLSGTELGRLVQKYQHYLYVTSLERYEQMFHRVDGVIKSGFYAIIKQLYQDMYYKTKSCISKIPSGCTTFPLELTYPKWLQKERLTRDSVWEYCRGEEKRFLKDMFNDYHVARVMDKYGVESVTCYREYGELSPVLLKADKLLSLEESNEALKDLFVYSEGSMREGTEIMFREFLYSMLREYSQIVDVEPLINYLDKSLYYDKPVTSTMV
jgi:hypothetical protein